MNTRNVILFLTVAVLTFSSCKESEDETINPVTEEILANGLNIGPNGVDTTVVFLKANGYSVDINYSSGTGKWCSATECTDSVTGAPGIRIKCASSDTSLFVRKATVNISSSRGNYVVKVNQKPYKLAYFNNPVLYIKNTGGVFMVPVRANSSFTIGRVHELIGSGNNTREVNKDWVSIKGQYGKKKCSEGKTLEFPFMCGLNTGLGRSASFTLGVFDDSLDNHSSILEVRQEPRTFNSKETINLNIPEIIEVLLGRNEDNLSRLRSLTMIGSPAPQDVEYAAKIGRLSLDTLDMSACDFTGYSYEFNIDERLFFNSHLSRILLPKGIKTINEEAFADCKNLKTVVLPASLEHIRSRAFASSPKIDEIVIPADSKLKAIYEEPFNTGGVLKSLFIPKSIKYMDADALKGLRVKELHIRLDTPPSLNQDGDIDRSGSILYVPKGCKEKYMSATYWKSFGQIVEE
ncbi:leucine-rich repeat domain-containing protein [Hallella multisaccharivorax]|uniref:leucine-rich repeat domain-containing protein n=1 Tax=Hallella multisaccharivorax TaxID=310514 RepID=UPI0036234337